MSIRWKRRIPLLPVLAMCALGILRAHPTAAALGPRGTASDPTIRATVLARPVAPAFANRVAAPAHVEPHARGRLDARELAHGRLRSIELAAGYTLVPGVGATGIPAELARLRRAPEAPGRDSYLVQFASSDPDSARARIERAGGAVMAALADVAWLVRMDADTRARLTAGDGAPWVQVWEPAFKLSPRLERGAPGRVEVKALLYSDADVEGTAAALAALGATRVRGHRGQLNRLVRFELDRARVAEAAALDDVAWLEPAPRDTVLNDLSQWVVQTGLPDQRKMWDHGLRGAGQIVMTSDSGVRTNHMLFWDAAHDITGWGHYPEHRKVVAYLPGSGIPENAFGDEYLTGWHGTHTAGTIAGDDEPNASLPYDGIAKDARLWVTDLSGPAGGGGIYPPDDLNDLFLPSYQGNAAGAARIATASWGSPAWGGYTLSSMEVDQFTWHHPDYVVAFANGNDGYAGTVGSPATAKNCISVGGTGNGSQMNWVFPYTSRGPTTDLRRKPTVCAPGQDVISSVANTRYGYASYSGTSMATPAVAGALAIARQYLTEGWYPTGAPAAANGFSPSGALLKAMIVGSAVNDVLGFAAPDNNIGWGRVSLDQVLYFPGDSARTLLVDGLDGLLHHDYVEYQVRVTQSVVPLRVALVWTDAPGNPAVVSQIVNDLDLIVTNGTETYLGNRLANGTSRTGGSRDSINVEECVRLPSPAPGLWTVRIEARRVTLGPQPFALCITGAVGGDGGAVATDRNDYALEDTLGIQVIDFDAGGAVSVTVASATEPAGETLVLKEAAAVYRGALPLAPVAAIAGDGRLAVSSGDAVTVTYVDATSGTSLSAGARVHAQAPVVTDVHARALGTHSALVTWTTDIIGTSGVRFGETLPFAQVADSSGLTATHRVLLTGLAPGTLYRYDVESVSHSGSGTRDSLGGAHRSFTTPLRGQFALVLGNAGPKLLDTWSHALEALGWDAEILSGAAIQPPRAGGPHGLRDYTAVMWQVDPDVYPPFSDAQRATVDSLLQGGGRLMVTGHDIGYAFADAASPIYTPERELWVESGLKARYYYDDLSFSQLTGTSGDPVSGAWTAGIPYYPFGWGMAGDGVLPAPVADGTATAIWKDNGAAPAPVAIRWESNGPLGLPGDGVWGGATSKLVAMFCEWAALGSLGTAHEDRRTGVLASTIEWLVGHRAPHVAITSPAPGEVVTGNYLPVRWQLEPDSGRSVAHRELWCSLDGGETWGALPMAACSDSGTIVDLGGVLGGPAVPNSARALLRVVVADNGTPSLRGIGVMDGVFTLARAAGDGAGPVAVAGSIGTTPSPVRRDTPALLHATFSDMETGGGGISVAEYSWGSGPATPGAGRPMNTTSQGNVAVASADLPMDLIPLGAMTLWLRARDTAGNWGPAGALAVHVNGDGLVAVDDPPHVDFLSPPTPNPSRGEAAIRFGLSRSGAVRLELFDLAGRRVRTLVDGPRPAGAHAALWDGHDDDRRAVGAGVYFVRLVTPAGTYRSRLISLP